MRKILKLIWLKSLQPLGIFSQFIGLSRLSFKSSLEVSPFPLIVRKLLDASAPVNPLAKSGLAPEIEICIPCTEKDLILLREVIGSAIITSENRVGSIRVVVPHLQVEIFEQHLGNQFRHHNLVVISEADLLGELIHLCISVAPPTRRGWLIQQIVKFMCVLTSEYKGVLILDSDTVLTSCRTWLRGDQTQILMISEEYHAPYQQHFLKFQESSKKLKVPYRNPRVSFVTHHQLMQPTFLREMFGGYINWKHGLESWIIAVKFEGESPACEYHCYGTYMVTNNPRKILFARWGNIAIARSDARISNGNLDSVTLRTNFPSHLSVSMHAYLS